MESQVLDGYGRSCGLTEGIPLALRQKARPQLWRKIFKIGDEFGLLVPCAPFDNEKAENDGHNHPNGGGSHAQSHGIVPLESAGKVFKSAAYGRCSSVPAVKARREHGSERAVEVRPDGLEEIDSKKTHNAPLEKHSQLGVNPHRPHAGNNLLDRSLLGGKRKGGKNKGNQNGRIGRKIS